jgi:hypothetical protein
MGVAAGSIISAMQRLMRAMRVTYSDPEINSAVRDASPRVVPYTRHFNRNEEFFVRLPAEFTVGSLPYHHDVQSGRPAEPYVSAVRDVMKQLVRIVPDIFEGLTHTFDPTEVFLPTFFRLYRLEKQTYLYQLRVDLQYRPLVHEAIERGTNEYSASYRTNVLVLESDIIPLSGVDVQNGKIRGFEVEQVVSDTWVGESGRGYFVQGIWLDRDITRFFSKLFIAPGVRPYPYYPFTCKYRAICHTAATLGEEARRRSLPLLHDARKYLLPRVSTIEDALRQSEFAESLPSFQEMKARVPADWADRWRDFSIRVYLNDEKQKEYELEHGLV